MATEYASEFPEYIITGLLSDGPTIDVIGDASSTPVILTWHPDPAHNLAWITSLLVWIEGSGPVRLDTYGTISTMMNGVRLSIQGPSGTIWQSGEYKRNADWLVAAQDMTVLEGLGQHKGVLFRLTMENFSNHPMPVEVGNWVQAEFTDDFTGLMQNRIYIRGGYATP